MSDEREKLMRQALEQAGELASYRRRAMNARPALRDLSLPQFHALLMLQEQGSCTVSDLAQHLCVSAPSASSIIDRMEERGFVRRVRDIDDRRVVHVQVAEGGNAVVEEMMGMKHEFMLRVLNSMTEDELRAVVAFGAALRAALGRIAAADCSGHEKLPD
jgi:MarR family transcriptional regulator, organic hydroperoxide resistance regulator